MRADVLVLSSLYDLSSDLVCDELRTLGVDFVRINSETLPNSRVRFDPAASTMEFSIDRYRWELTPDVGSIWFRQPVFLRETAGRPLSLEQQLSRSQWSAFMRGMTVFEDALWVNHPAKTYLAECKPYQLRCAAKLGFLVPATTITNDLDALRSPDLGDPFVLKSIDTALLQDGPDELFAYSSIVSAQECAEQDFAAVPSTCQKLIHPKIDLRVTVIGAAVFCVAITNRDTGIEGDWRLTARENLRYSDFVLPSEEEQRCKLLVQALGLEFGAIDLVATPTGIYFIEINPTGEWSWLNSAERPIAATLARLLARKS